LLNDDPESNFNLYFSQAWIIATQVQALVWYRDFLIDVSKNGIVFPEDEEPVILSDKSGNTVDSFSSKRFDQNENVEILPQGNRLILNGDYWTISFNQKTVIIKNSKGMRYIDYLIRNKGKEIHVVELFYAIEPPDINRIDHNLSSMSEDELEAMGLSKAITGEKTERMSPNSNNIIKNRLATIAEKIEEAIEFGDEESQIKLENEQEKILKQLTSDYGLSGKSRNPNSLVEQIRKNITKSIIREKNKLKQKYPEFALHLICLKTGTFCCYQPDINIEWK
jgi:hypothetical protein